MGSQPRARDLGQASVRPAPRHLCCLSVTLRMGAGTRAGRVAPRAPSAPLPYTFLCPRGLEPATDTRGLKEKWAALPRPPTPGRARGRCSAAPGQEPDAPAKASRGHKARRAPSRVRGSSVPEGALPPHFGAPRPYSQLSLSPREGGPW